VSFADRGWTVFCSLKAQPLHVFATSFFAHKTVLYSDKQLPHFSLLFFIFFHLALLIIVS
jgi:hypothetical protein